MTETIKVSERQSANLDWSFSQIKEFMDYCGLCILKSKKTGLMVTMLEEAGVYIEDDK